MHMYAHQNLNSFGINACIGWKIIHDVHKITNNFCSLYSYFPFHSWFLLASDQIFSQNDDSNDAAAQCTVHKSIVYDGWREADQIWKKIYAEVFNNQQQWHFFSHFAQRSAHRKGRDVWMHTMHLGIHSTINTHTLLVNSSSNLICKRQTIRLNVTDFSVQ